MDLSPDEDNFQGRLLHQAALWDNVEFLEELLASGTDINARDGFGRSCIHAAAVSEDSKCLTVLCEHGADLEVRSDERQGGKTALHIAAERGHLSNVRVLCRAGADALAKDASGATAAELAGKAGYLAVVAVLETYADAQERERLAHHSALRSLIAQGDCEALKRRLSTLGSNATLVVNLTPGGANTLLFVASEAGLSSAVAALLEAGADGRAHSVTKYSPLYAAAYHGHVDVARMLLKHFPEAVRLETVEKWLPLHAACIGGHAPMVSLLLEFPYPDSVLETFTDKSGRWQYRFAFDINASDVRGQTAVCIASALGSLPVLTAILNFTVACERVPGTGEDDKITPEVEQRLKKVLSPTRGGISLGIHAIVSRLTGASKNSEPMDSQSRVSPVNLAAGCGASCVALATRGQHALCVAALLAAGASAHSVIQLDPESSSSRKSRSTSAPPARRNLSPGKRDRSKDRDTHYTALAIAIRNKNLQIAEMLLQHNATDDNWQALREAVQNNMLALIPKILNTKAYQDPENKVNRPLISRSILSSGSSTLSLNARCPSVPVLLNWQGNNVMDAVRVSWLRAAALRLNPGVSHVAALHAITRIDLSNNELRSLPHEIFTMMSLRYLNVAQNKLETLPAVGDSYEEDEDRRKAKRVVKVVKEVYTAPALQDLYLQDNRLEALPPALFALPALATLDVSNNKLRELAPQVWAAPSLKDLNAAFNHLKDLPQRPASSPALSPTSEAPAGRKSNRESTASELADIVQVDRKLSSAPRHYHGWAGREWAELRGPTSGSALTTLNLSHNQYTTVPAVLACVAPNLTRLNMAYNSLRSMSYVTSYPKNLRQLDLSHNEITCWPSLPPLEDSTEPASPLHCACSNPQQSAVCAGRAASYRSALLTKACANKRHLTLHSLRTLILSNNLLTRIQLTTDDDGSIDSEDLHDSEEDHEWGEGTSVRSRLVFPQLSMLDISCNALRCVPPSIQYLTNLCVFNISGNKEVTTLPASMGVLTRLWSVSTTGCSLTEPLRSLLATRCRSADVIGYLRSVLHEARPYRNLKLMCVGQQGIGKTSLLECLRQESGMHHRRKHTEHWAARMGNKVSTKNMSTVGVDIGVWTYEKQRSTRGPIHFRTWDFGGQQEYYATHQYFLSKRSLYLVVWKVTDGRKGLAGALDWLRSIQARAPGSPVIMVATHYDQVPNSNLPENESPEMLQRIIRTSIMGAPDGDKLGLPRVMDSVEVSCSTRHNMRLLADILYSVAYSVKPPGSKEPVLEQRVPASYLALEECVTHLAAELKDPVLRHDEYKRLVTQYMQQKNYRMFRDASELHQATMFLHDNGVILHYDDATLRQLYFLRPQWLCDLLAHVVSVREVNPFVNNGIMKTEDLCHVFKASPQLGGSEEASTLALALLGKFELALCWQPRLLLVPPLLPDEEPSVPQLPIKSREWSSRLPRRWQFASSELARTSTDSPTLVDESTPEITITPRAGSPLRRVFVLSYVPPGLWARLCTRLVAAAPGALPLYSTELELDESISKALDFNWCWKLWKKGMKLVCGDITLVSVSEIAAEYDDLLPLPGKVGGTRVRYRVKQDDSWSLIDAESSARIELVVPSQTCTVRRTHGEPIAGYQSITLEPNPEILAKILALVSDQLDMLLEDWYPSLGTRFVHTSEGRSLITRLIPCPGCLKQPDNQDQDALCGLDEFQKIDLEVLERPRLSQESRLSDADSGVGAESHASSRLGSVEGVAYATPHTRVVHAWTVEQTTAAALTCTPVHCPTHGECGISGLAPDLMLLDIEESMRARWEHISRLATCGRGAFGTVLTAEWSKPDGQRIKVALKALQPVAPPTRDPALLQKYKADLSRWQRSTPASATRAYLALRQESLVLQALRHPHTLRLLGLCAAPAALLLPLAPLGALDGILRQYQACGCRVPPRITRAVALQMARALEYLHAMRVLYRDLKSENVLVWEMPTPQEALAAEYSPDPVKVFVKLGDYGISRMASTTGIKGFGGTEGFMAPEIMKYNGEEEYNEKVDCFSYGMLLYEIITLRQPFEGHEAVKEAILDGARPALSPREVQYPVCILETMRSCWNSAPELRPSAAALVSLCSAPEWCNLVDAVFSRRAAAATCVPVVLTDCSRGGWDVWTGGTEPERVHTTTVTPATVLATRTVTVPADKSGLSVVVTALCRVSAAVWVGDSIGRVHVYCASSCTVLWSVDVPAACGNTPSAVIAMCHLSDLQRVALALTCGRLFLVTSGRPEPESEGSFILTELGTATQLNCLVAVPMDNCWSVWAGGDTLCVYALGDGGVRAADAVSARRVRLMAAVAGGVVLYADEGSTIYRYNTSRSLTARLDVSKLVPCSETLDSIALDDQPVRNVVTALTSVRSQVYLGTASGCVIVADAACLRPLTVFRPLHSEIMTIVGLEPHAGMSDSGAEEPPFLLTFGTGYRPLLQRYAPQQPQPANASQPYTGPFCLLWRAHHWLPD